jgi:hypothetical protein
MRKLLARTGVGGGPERGLRGSRGAQLPERRGDSRREGRRSAERPGPQGHASHRGGRVVRGGLDPPGPLAPLDLAGLRVPGLLQDLPAGHCLRALARTPSAARRPQHHRAPQSTRQLQKRESHLPRHLRLLPVFTFGHSCILRIALT